MKNLKNKLNKKGGFTLIEMLIVVAIIAILIAVSIPLVSGALERTRVATDAANERAAKAEAVIVYLSDELDAGVTFTPGEVYYYNASEGRLEDAIADITVKYGKCKAHNDDMVIAVIVNDDGEVYMAWTKTAITEKDTTKTPWSDAALDGATL